MAGSPGREGNRVQVLGVCRGEALCYAAVALDDAARSLSASARSAVGAEVPATCWPVDLPGTREAFLRSGDVRAVWVVGVPLLSVDCTVALADLTSGEELGSLVLSAVGSKFQSRLLTATRPRMAEAMRGMELRRGEGATSVDVIEAWPKGENVVWRVSVRFAEAEGTPELRILDGAARPVDGAPIVMEDHVVGEPAERLVTFSVELPRGVRHFVMVATCGHESGFTAMHPNRAAGMLAASESRLGAAWADPGYERWFEAHRATPAQLAQQRTHAEQAAARDELPTFSIVVPVYRTPRPFLEECIASVEAQSYPSWELVLVDASGPWPEVDSVLKAHADPRIRVLVVENRSISENTNVGIDAATGEYVCFLDHDDALEPDALWCYWRATVKTPDVDLLYCDEDHLAGVHVHGPAFKSPPSLTKLRAYNYVTHFLCVSRRVLDATERSGADVAGAQDFDLTLKAFEVARTVVKVPRVLYHWREHEGSTSGGGNQKPYAHTAGVLALERHLARMGQAAAVEDGPLPYTYRVRYALPSPAPLVSVVIPSRDHAGLLSACVQSVLERSTYPRLEVVVVENSSVEPETFALYERLTHDPRVRVVTWRPEDAGLPAGAFNYSALVNCGARVAAGDVLVFLNNDTEVIAPDWLDLLVGELQRPEVGVVGAKLLFEDGLVQHAGVVANPNCDFAHVNQNLTADALGYGYSAGLPGDFSMVTGACQGVRREVWDELGGYCEELAVGFNDGDFCLRAREAGYVVAFVPYAVLHHREFSSRGRETADPALRTRYLAEKALMVRRHPGFFAVGDPAVDPNLDGFSNWFQLPQG